VIDGLLKSPYVFIVRSVVVQNDKTTSPQVADLDKMAGTNGPGVSDSSPGSVGTTKTDAAPQWLFGKELLHIKIRVDLIEWNGLSHGSTSNAGTRRGGRNGRPGGGGGGAGGGAGGNE
jgi:hypothetical protein